LRKFYLGLNYRFPDARVWGKHSAWMSSRSRAEARTHHPQRNDAQKPSSGRKGDHEVVEGARVTLSLHKLISTRSPSPDSVGSSLPEGAFRKFPPIENTTKEKSLVVFVFSPLKMHSSGRSMNAPTGGERIENPAIVAGFKRG